MDDRPRPHKERGFRLPWSVGDAYNVMTWSGFASLECELMPTGNRAIQDSGVLGSKLGIGENRVTWQGPVTDDAL